MEAERLFLTPFFLSCFVFLGLSEVLLVSATHHHHQAHGSQLTKLFVFGDSYSATGNNKKSGSPCWSYPYGITFPGKPSGRFSDGRVLTDFIAKFIGVRSPWPYKFRKFGGNTQLKYGLNFAYGGTGVFDTFVVEPNMTTQIDFLQRLIEEKVYNAPDLYSSVALITVAGNDYTTFAATMPSAESWKPFITAVVNQLALNLKRINDLGVKKILVTALEPIGCLPSTTARFSFQKCNKTTNSQVKFHNLLLQQAVAQLNSRTKNNSFIILDLYASFMSVLKYKGDHLGRIKFENPLRPCCFGISKGYRCGSVDDKTGEIKYSVCDVPKSAFFWDDGHLTQQGWRAVYLTLQPTLEQLHY